MDIVCCPDKNYVMPTGVMICSLCENNREETVNFHIIHVDLSEKDKASLENIVHRYNKTVYFYKIQVDKLPDITIGQERQQKMPLSTYYRLFMVDILPKEVSKVIYLDGDIIVCDSLRSLWREDVENIALAAVPDANYFSSRVNQSYNYLKYSPALGYFNAGVLLINLDFWRDRNVVNDFRNLIASRKEGFIHHDQDILNYVFRENKKFLPLKYNLMVEFLLQPKYREISWEYDEEIDQAARNPVIIHYSNSKPWLRACDHPYKKEFIKYKSLTEWSNIPAQVNLKIEFRRLVKRILIRLGLLSKSYIHQWGYSYSDLQNK